MANNGHASREVAFVAISGLSFPTRSRKYLINLVREAVVEKNAKSVIVAGHTVDGKFLEREFKDRLKEHLKTFSPRLKGNELEWEKEEFEIGFVAEYARQLDDFFPQLPDGVNWHIAIAERIYDRPIGAKILEKLGELRSDVRIIGERLEDGFYDREPKFPVQFPGFEDIRIIVPHRSPWFSKQITNLVQRLQSPFASRTLSPKPSLILAGATGTAAHLPFLDGVQTISVPALNKLVDQQGTEHMIGATVIRIIANGKEGPIVKNGVYNFRTAAFMEKQVGVPASLPKVQQAVMHALVPSDASMKAIVFRANKERKRLRLKTDFKPKQVKKALTALIASKRVVFSKKSNRYGINPTLRRNARITLAKLREGARTIKHVVWSCLHGGSVKTLYFTFLKSIPRLARDADACIENGDLLQGISHNYQTNGELLPIANGVDKQELISAHMRAMVLLGVFRIRLKELEGRGSMTAAAILKVCLIPYLFNAGNHDKWGFWNKMTLILQQYEDKLLALVLEGVLAACEEAGVKVTVNEAKAAVRASIIRVGESRMVELDGITIAIKHPHKSRTMTKSTRIQQVAEFIWQRFQAYVGSVAKSSKNVSLVYVANFHEAAAAHITKFGQTVLGVMTGAFLYDTEFENHMDKVVDYGPAVVSATFDKEGRLLYSETEFNDHIDDEDRVFVTADRLDSAALSQRCEKLLERIELKLPWR